MRRAVEAAYGREGEVRRQQSIDASHEDDAAISVEEFVERLRVHDVLVGLLPQRGLLGLYRSAAARCFDQASFEVMGQRAVLPPRGSAVIPPLGSCGRALLAAIIAKRHW